MKLFKILTSLSLLTAFTYANESLLNLHKNLIEKPSITKTETEAVDYLYNHLQSLGWKVELQTVNNPSVDQSVRRQNIFAYLGDNRDDVSLILNSHLDVVPPYVPYRKEVTNNNKEIIYGRGSNDAKGQIAAQVTAIETLRQQSFDKINNVGVLYDVGEEGIFDGMSTAQSILPPSLKYVVVGEPTELKQISGHKGNMGFEIRAKGLAAHSSNPQWGINAIEKLSEAVLKLKDIKLPKDDLLGDTTIAVTKISGGTAINKVPDEAVAYVNVRTSVPCQQTWEIIKNSDLVNEYIDLVLVDDPHDPVKVSDLLFYFLKFFCLQINTFM